MAFADLLPGCHSENVHDHWWWRPGWRQGRHFYAFHITFPERPHLFQLVGRYRAAVRTVGAATTIPDQWLHMTMQGIGFTDEVPQSTLNAIAAEVRAALATCNVFEIQFERAYVATEAVGLPAEPSTPIKALRQAVRAAMARVLGEKHVPEDAQRYRPHVSVAYLTTEGTARPYIDAVENVQTDAVRITVDTVELIEMNRDHRMYEWTTVEKIPLGLTRD